MGKYERLTYIAQGYATNIFIDTYNNKLKVYRLKPSDQESMYKLNEEGKKLLWKIYKLYGKIPKNFYQIPSISQKDFAEVFDRSEGKTEEVLKEYLKIRGEEYYPLGSDELLKHIQKELPYMYTKEISSGLNHNIVRSIDKSVLGALKYGNHILKKEYIKQRRHIKKIRETA